MSLGKGWEIKTLLNQKQPYSQATNKGVPEISGESAKNEKENPFSLRSEWMPCITNWASSWVSIWSSKPKFLAWKTLSNALFPREYNLHFSWNSLVWVTLLHGTIPLKGKRCFDKKLDLGLEWKNCLSESLNFVVAVMKDFCVLLV